MFFEDCRGKDFRDDPERPARIVVQCACTDPECANAPVVIELPAPPKPKRKRTRRRKKKAEVK